jgi:hypothetical protein
MGEGLRGNPAGRLRGSRNRLSEEVICALLRDFREHGQKAIAEVRRKQPGVYLKVVALLIPREHKLEHSNSLKELADEQIEQAIEAIQGMLEARTGEVAKVIEGTAEPAALPASSRKPRRKCGAGAKAFPLLLDGQGDSE